MFGLMRPQSSCSNKINSDYRQHRMHYCGTCKTLGQEYGQPTRMLLNFDTVFFAEILSHLSKENLSNWQAGYQAINRCFTMPDEEQAVPPSLKYAAASNVLLGGLKLDDRCKDLPGVQWKLARLFFSKPFRKAEQQLQKWGLDTQQLWHWIQKQAKLEKTAKLDFPSLSTLLNHYAEPTAQITGLVFQKGANCIGQPEHEKAMFQLGYQFGRVVYILDAFEDVEIDLYRQQFNPLSLFFDAKKTLQEGQFAQVRQVLLAGQEAVAQQLKALPFPAEIIGQYTARLRSNMALRLYRERQVPKTLYEQINDTWKTIAEKTVLATSSYLRSPHYYLVSLVVFLIPLAADYVGYAHKGEVYKRAAIFTAALAAIGLGRQALVRRKKRKALRKDHKGIGKIRRFFQRLPLLFVQKDPCAEDCTASCCDSCCQTCCDELCNSICHEGLCNGEKGGQALLILVVLLLILIVVMMILLLV